MYIRVKRSRSEEYLLKPSKTSLWLVPGLEQILFSYMTMILYAVLKKVRVTYFMGDTKLRQYGTPITKMQQV